MTPLTKEQAEVVALSLEARAQSLWKTPVKRIWLGISPHQEASVCDKLATEIRNGTFIEVAPPETGQ